MSKISVLANKKIRNAQIQLSEYYNPDDCVTFWRVSIEVPGRCSSAPYDDLKEAKKAYNENVRTISLFGTMYD